MNRILDEVWNTEAILDSIDNYESLVLEHDEYYFNHAEYDFTAEDYPDIFEESFQPIETAQDYRDVVEDLRLFIKEQPEMVLADLEPMFDLPRVAPSLVGQTTPASGSVTAEQLMSYMDMNGDGKITMEEAPEELKTGFDYIDTNGDGGIDAQEAQIMADYANQGPAGQAAPASGSVPALFGIIFLLSP